MAASWLEVLRQSPLLVALDEPAREVVLGSATLRRLRRGQVLFRQGEPAQALYVAVEGRLKLTQEDAAGHQVVVRFVRPPQPMAAVALAPGHTYPVTAQAITDAWVALWPAAALRELCRRLPPLGVALMEQVAGHVEDLQQRVLELACERVEQRLARCLWRLARQVGLPVAEGLLLDIPLTRQDLAAMVGATLYTVSRLLQKWQARGLVRTGRQRVVVSDFQGLLALAEGKGG
ncbi:MAG: Crp/Fnr family transcriptional regulator [Thermoanaerobaculum sp.]|nr:Crp/Fnr family transcriptional regulator [Thermoanaerobaculum sp.]MDW7968766.1 Crp/Fnr family transcriptional regulator [Thermoanaerobaculum sp.]